MDGLQRSRALPAQGRAPTQTHAAGEELMVALWKSFSGGLLSYWSFQKNNVISKMYKLVANLHNDVIVRPGASVFTSQEDTANTAI